MNTPTMSLFRLRDMDNVHLVNFFQLTLKSKNDFDAAFDLVLSTRLSEYLKLFLIPQPGDWPAQFYSRQVIYETLQKFCCPSDVFDNPQECQVQIIHMQESALLDVYDNKWTLVHLGNQEFFP